MARILVIEHEPILRGVICMTLEEEGYEVLEAPTGKEGIKLTRAKRPEVILLEVLMPEEDGSRTLQELRQETRPMKIIAMSAGSPRIPREDLLTAATDLGAH